MAVDDVIRHGAPTLAGLKTGNLFPCSCSDRGELLAQLRLINRVLVPRGLRLLPLRLEEGRALLYLFRPGRLSEDLAEREAERILDRAGYRDRDWIACLRELKRRLTRGHLLRDCHERGSVTFENSLPEKIALCERLLYS